MHERIKKLRKTLDLTQKEFGERIGVKPNTIATYEIGRNAPIDAVISLICREFGVSEEWLRTGEGEMFDQKRKTAVDRLCAELCASELESEIIRAYFQISPQIREPFVRQLIQEMQSPTRDSGKDVHVHTTGQEQLETAEEISPQLPIGSIQSELVDSEENVSTKEAEALYRSSSGYVVSADSSALNSTGGIEKTGEVKPA